MSPAGERLDPDPILLSATGPGFSERVAVSFDGTNYLAVWADQRDADDNLYGARISPAGTLLDPGGIAISTAFGPQFDPAVSFDGSNHLVVWTDTRDDGVNVWAARVNPTGSVHGEMPVSNGSHVETAPDVASDGTGSLVVWQDDRSGSNDILSTWIGTTGGPISPAGVPISSATGDQSDPSVTWNGGRYLVVWTDGRGGTTTDIYGARVTRSSRVQDPAGLAISTAPDDQTQPTTVANGAMFMVAWTDRRSGSEPDIYGARVDSTGIVRDEDGFAIAANPRAEAWPAMVKGSGIDVGAVWTQHRASSGLSEDGVGFLREVSPK